MATTVEKKCRCGNTFSPRVVDVKRGWGKFCSKSCKAKEQEKRTGQYKDYMNRRIDGIFYNKDIKQDDSDIIDYDPGWDSHKNCF